MAFFKEALNERGIGRRANGGNSPSIKRRSFWSRATWAGVNLPARKTRFQTFFAILFSPFPLGLRNFVGGDDPHGILGALFINDNNEAAIRSISPHSREPAGLALTLFGRVLQDLFHVFDG